MTSEAKIKRLKQTSKLKKRLQQKLTAHGKKTTRSSMPFKGISLLKINVKIKVAALNKVLFNNRKKSSNITTRLMLKKKSDSQTSFLELKNEFVSKFNCFESK